MILRARAALERLLRPGLGTCGRCRRPWRDPAHKTARWVGVDGHTTDYGGGRGCFALCEGCWSSLVPEERCPYYRELVSQWIFVDPGNIASYLRDERRILDAVARGG